MVRVISSCFSRQSCKSNSVSLLRAAEKVDDELYWIFLLGAMIFATTLPFSSKI